jgi:hypothetical protein
VELDAALTAAGERSAGVDASLSLGKNLAEVKST